MVFGNVKYRCSLCVLFAFVSKIAVSVVPYRKDFVAALKKAPSTTDEQLYEDMKVCLAALKSNIDEINRFYTERGQHSDNTV